MTREAPPDRDAMRRRSPADGAVSAAEGPLPVVPRVRFVADLACPWCYLGFHRLERLARRVPLRLVWHPFLLNPHLPPEGVPRALYLERKFGAAAGADQAHRRAATAAAADGLEMRLERIRRQPSTVAAHAMLLAAGERAAPPLARALFEAFFRDGGDLGSPAVLAAAAAPLGLAPPPRLDGAAAGEVLAAHDAACRSGVDGVPLFLFGEDHAIAGAQPEACLEALAQLELYRLAREAGAAAALPAQGRHAS